jgi:secreted PhoX family phosphatase
MGRFVHEAVAVDRRTGMVYLTEDTDRAGLYRFLPKRKKHLPEGGELQMLAIKDAPDYDTRTKQRIGVGLEVMWVTIDNPDPETADIDELAVFKQGRAKGAATFERLEGCHADRKGRIFFVSTSGGDNNGGQIWRYEADGRDAGRLTLLFESPSRDILDMPDNVCLMPSSELIFLCEDSDYVGGGGTIDNYLRILTPAGKIADFAKNVSAEFPRSEFAGSTFSPDGKTLFVNLQQAGVTCAIWGDWKRFRS